MKYRVPLVLLIAALVLLLWTGRASAALGFARVPATGSGVISCSDFCKYTSGRGAISSAHTGIGTYTVTFAGLQAPATGMVGLTSLIAPGQHGNFCVSTGVQQLNGGQDLRISVACYNSDGANLDQSFLVSYRTETTGNGNEAAYALSANDAGGVSFAYNGKGGSATITRASQGDYFVQFTGMNPDPSNGGTVIVTSAQAHVYCKVLFWSTTDPVDIEVRCFQRSGVLTDARFYVWFGQFSANGPFSYGYAWAEQPATMFYVPDPFYQIVYRAGLGGGFQGPANVTRIGTGQYLVQFPGLDDGAARNFIVSAYGSSTNICNLSAVSATTQGIQATVNCWTPGSGTTAVDDLFVINAGSNEFRFQ